MDEKKVFKRNNQVVTREIEGEVMLLPLYKSSKSLNCIYILNETAVTAWEMIDGKSSLAKIKGLLLDKFEIDETELTKQLDELIKDLKSIKAVI